MRDGPWPADYHGRGDSSGAHAAGPVADQGRGEQTEFELALALLLDGFERLHATGWTAPPRSTSV